MSASAPRSSGSAWPFAAGDSSRPPNPRPVRFQTHRHDEYAVARRVHATIIEDSLVARPPVAPLSGRRPLAVYSRYLTYQQDGRQAEPANNAPNA